MKRRFWKVVLGPTISSSSMLIWFAKVEYLLKGFVWINKFEVLCSELVPRSDLK